MIRRFAAIAVVCALCLGGCAINPATGRKELSFYGEQQEVAMGREYDQETLRELTVYGTPEQQAWLQQLGASLSAKSERPGLQWTFRLVDDPAVNAFALPGGFIYITRGLMTHMNSEAELASVVGHEIGHVTARHSVNQMSKMQVAQLGFGLGMVLSSKIAEYGDVFQQALGLMFLKFSRDDERQADELGLRYIVRTGYDARLMPEVFAVLGAVGRLEGGGRLPDWQSTHPNPEDRRQRMTQAIAALPQNFSGAKVERDSYLARLDGMMFGENPAGGFLRGQRIPPPGHEVPLRHPPGMERPQHESRRRRPESPRTMRPSGSRSPTRRLPRRRRRRSTRSRECRREPSRHGSSTTSRRSSGSSGRERETRRSAARRSSSRTAARCSSSRVSRQE